MIRSIVILFLVTVIAAIGCSKKTDVSKFAGAWNGSYNSAIITLTGSDTGTVHIVVDANNNATGTLQSLRGGTPSVMKGKVDPSSGAISITAYGEENYGVTIFLEALTGTLSGNAGSGTLAFPWATTSEWRATRN